ncbi:hypothetical protein [Nocardia sp. NPDC057440]|uniref:hypothetical protein n=1 Tax=Nocardia sp. NPDC057440 TaxID=3346134 RepID=UPI00366EFFD9
MTEMGEQECGPVRRLPVDSSNAGPRTESWIRFEKHAVALQLIRELLDGTGLVAAAPQHSSDVVMMYGDARPKLVSIKHREPNRVAGDSGWNRTDLKEVFQVLHRQWSQAGRVYRPVFWSNAGFVGPARRDHDSVIEGAPSADFVDWLVTVVGLVQAEACGFAADLELAPEPLPRKFEIVATGAAAVAQFLARRGRGFARLHAEEAFEALTERIAELSRERPEPPRRDARIQLIEHIYPLLTAGDARALAARTLPVAEIESIVLGEHDRRLAATLPKPGQGWVVDNRFVGRGAALARLGELLDPGGVGEVVPVVVRGMTGCGKTSVAVQFAAMQREALRSVFVKAVSRAEVIAALQQLSGHGEDLQNVGIAEARIPVTPALPATTGLLLILDGVDDPDIVRGLIPRRSLCRVLITTTVTNLDSGYQELALSSWDPQESRAFLGAHLPHEPSSEHERLRAGLYDHPLALNQAVDHCRVLGRTIEGYLAPSINCESAWGSAHPEPWTARLAPNWDAAPNSTPNTKRSPRWFSLWCAPAPKNGPSLSMPYPAQNTPSGWASPN